MVLEVSLTENICVCGKQVYIDSFCKKCEKCLGISSNAVQNEIKTVYPRTTMVYKKFDTCELCKEKYNAWKNYNPMANTHPQLFTDLNDGVRGNICCDCLLVKAENFCVCGKQLYPNMYSKKCETCLNISSNETQNSIRAIYRDTATYRREFNMCEICNGKFNKCKYGNPIAPIYPTLFTGTSDGINSEICCDCLLVKAKDL